MSLIQSMKTRIAARIWPTVGAAMNRVNSAIAGRGSVDTLGSSWMGELFRVTYERQQIHKDIALMDESDELVSFALGAIASRALGYEDRSIDAFTVSVHTKDGKVHEDAQEIVDNLIERCELRHEAYQIIRKGVKFGNEAREVVWDLSQDFPMVDHIQHLPEHTIWPNKTPRGQRLPGYVQRPEFMPPGASEVAFDEAEMILFTYGEEENYLGTPLLKSARKNWKRLSLALDSTAMARLIRAFMKMVHRVPVGSDWSPQQKKQALEDYKSVMTKRQIFDQSQGSITEEAWPATVSTDLYLTDDGSGRGDVTMLDPENAQLQNITDIEHFTDRLIAATTVPKRYFPFANSTAKLSEGGGTAEDKHFAATLMMCQMMLKRGYEKLFKLELAARGIDTSNIKFDWTMAAINTTDMFRVSQTEVNNMQSLTSLLTIYPEFRLEVSTILKEFTLISEAAKAILGKIELDPDYKIPTKGGGQDDRIQMPGLGAGPEARKRV